MLLKVYRNLVYIHDDHIYAANLYGSVYKEIPEILMPKIKKTGGKPFHIEVFSRISHRGLERIPGFYEKVDRLSESGLNEEELMRILDEARPRGIYDYALRGLERNLFQYLVSAGYVWVVPYRNVYSMEIRRQDGLEIIAIRYRCPFTNRLRIFKTVYNPEIYNLIKELCIRNGNRAC